MTRIPDRVDRYTAQVAADTEGAWTFEVQAWSDPLATWLHDTEIKMPAGVDVELMFTEGGLLLDRMGAEPGLTAQEKAFVADTAKGIRDTTRPVEARLAASPTSAELRDLAHAHPLRDLVSPSRGPTRSSWTAAGRSTAAGTSSSRAPRARPSTRRAARSPPAPSAPRRSGSTPSRPWAST